MSNPFVHVELHTTDLARAKEFYGKLFEWKLEDAPMADGTSYTLIGVGQGTGGGMMRQPQPGAPSAWLPYVAVEDVDAATRKARSLGANVTVEPTDIPGVGRFSVVVDPAGAPVALFKPSMPAR